MTLAALVAGVRHATLHVDATLRPGSYEIPGLFAAPTRLRIPREVQAAIELRIEREAPHLRIRVAKLTLSPALRILNPRRALHPPRGALRNLIDRIKDVFADLLADGANLDPRTGELEITGVIDVLHLAHRPIPPEIHPRVDLDLDQLLLPAAPGAVPPPAVPPPAVPPPLAAAILRALAQFIGPATLRAELEADPIALAGLPPQLSIAIADAPVRVALAGRAELAADGKLRVETTGAASGFDSGLASGALSGSVDVALDERGVATLDATGQLRVTPRVTQLAIDDPAGTHVALTCEAARGEIDVALAARVDGSGWSATAQAELAFEGRLAGPATVVKDGTKLTPRGLAVSAAGPVRVGASAQGIELRAPSLVLGATLPDADIELPFLGTCPLDLDLRAEALVTDLRVQVASRAVGGTIKLTYAFHPTGLIAELLPQLATIGRELALELQPGGCGRLDAPQGFFEQAIGPLLEFVGPPPAADPPAGPPLENTSALELGERIYQLTRAIPQAGNDVFVADAAAASAARVAMIGAARSTIVLQQARPPADAELAVVDALVAAARRGVRVRMLVDGIASLGSVADLAREHPITARLRGAGVDVRGFNDPRESGLGQLLEDISVVPELAGDSFEDLQQLRDPVKALGVFARLTALATANTGAVTPDVRARVARGLSQLLLTNRAFRQPVQPEQAQVPLGVLNQVVYAARQVVALSYRMTEPLLVADAATAVTGSPGAPCAGESLEAHVVISGPAAADIHNYFIDTWNQITGEAIAKHRGPARTLEKATVQIVSHQPRIDGAHRIAITMTEAVRATAVGERISIINPSFLPTGSLAPFKDALCAAARRGVTVRVLTNSAATSAAPDVVAAAVFTWRELLAAGCRIHASTARQIRAHGAAFGGRCAIVGSWSCDNRSELLTSGLVAIAYDVAAAAQIEALFDAGAGAGAADEIRLEAIASQQLGVELRSGWLASLGATL